MLAFGETAKEETLQQLLDVLEELRVKKVCSYLSQSFCDCKFGGQQIADLKKPEPELFFRESCGCPELRIALALLQRMKPEECDEIIRREPFRPIKKIKLGS